MAETASPPLGYFRGGYIRVSLEQEASDPQGLAIYSVILDYQGEVLLHRPEASAPWALPEAAGGQEQRGLGRLLDKLKVAGSPAELNFLYSVAEIPERGCTLIVYRGELQSKPKLTDLDRWQFFNQTAVPWEALASYETEMTLRRYFRERQLDRFGLFADDGDAGRLAFVGNNVRSYSRDDAERDLR